jgi:hypothetical protein
MYVVPNHKKICNTHHLLSCFHAIHGRLKNYTITMWSQETGVHNTTQNTKQIKHLRQQNEPQTTKQIRQVDTYIET